MKDRCAERRTEISLLCFHRSYYRASDPYVIQRAPVIHQTIELVKQLFSVNGKGTIA